MGNDDIKSIFIGPEFISMGDSRIKDNIIEFRDIKGLPIINKFRPSRSKPLDFDSMWEERTLFTNKGIEKDKVRIFWFDLHSGSPYMKMSNAKQVAELEYLKAKVLQLQNGISNIIDLVKDGSSDDRLKRKVKAEWEFYSQDLRPFSFGNKDGN